MKNKSVIKRIRLYPPCLYFLLEKWFKKMSLKGWHVFDCKVFIYYFEKGNPEEKEYFVYTPTYTGEGKYSIPMRYPFLRETYGVKKKYSKLNKNSFLKNNTIIEIDTNRIDIEHDIGYKELKSDRNRLYAIMTIRNFSIILMVIILIIILKKVI